MKPTRPSGVTLTITGPAFQFSIALDASYHRGTITLTTQEALDLFDVLARHHGDIWKAMVAERQQERKKEKQA